jgi:hypothetical protein
MHSLASVDQQGGLWWGSDEKPQGAVGRGEEAEDQVFREAEKLGIDVREADGTTAAPMTFGFFDAHEDPSAALESGPGAPVERRSADRAASLFDLYQWTEIVQMAASFCRTR